MTTQQTSTRDSQNKNKSPNTATADGGKQTDGNAKSSKGSKVSPSQGDTKKQSKN